MFSVELFSVDKSSNYIISDHLLLNDDPMIYLL